MRCIQKKFSVDELVVAWGDASLKVNEEYQRGARWTQAQKQALIDSIFRNYPIPPLFLHEIRSVGLGGRETFRFDIVDGQQRVRALAEYLHDAFPLLPTDNKKLRLPNSLRSLKAPWASKTFSDLDAELRQTLKSTQIEVFLIQEVDHVDEVRDLFIRLQSGTALSRQQIRDAWPGNMGPYVERLAGKLQKKPSVDLFQLADKRGARPEDDRDLYDADRQFCAQLLSLFLMRENDPCRVENVGANELDRLYHEYTEFDTAGPTARRFEALLQHATRVLDTARGEAEVMGDRKKRKFKKLDIMSLLLLLQDLTRDKNFKLDNKSYGELGNHLIGERNPKQDGKSAAGSTIQAYYEEWREPLLSRVGIRLDQKRAFDDQQKAEIFARDQGLCTMCGKTVQAGEDEYDHFPLPYAVGGKTVVENGRLVHKGCHARGRAALDVMLP